MAYKGKIITVGIRPAWDIKFYSSNLHWGDHKLIDSHLEEAAGKALNVSKALAWLGYGTVATGLWGNKDYEEMLSSLKPYSHCIDIRLTAVPGRTRRNVSIFDTAQDKELHLRLPGELATKASIRKLSDCLLNLVESDDLCIFAGALPEENAVIDEIVDLVWNCGQKGAKIVLDSSGIAFRKICSLDKIELVSPNCQELQELTSTKVRDDIESIARAAKKMLSNVNQVLMSLGKEGAIFVNKDGLWHSKFVGTPLPLQGTVGCGDYLLAGFIAGRYEDEDPAYALNKAVMLATAKAFGICTKEPWEIEQELDIETVYYNY